MPEQAPSPRINWHPTLNGHLRPFANLSAHKLLYYLIIHPLAHLSLCQLPLLLRTHLARRLLDKATGGQTQLILLDGTLRNRAAHTSRLMMACTLLSLRRHAKGISEWHLWYRNGSFQSADTRSTRNNDNIPFLNKPAIAK